MTGVLPIRVSLISTATTDPIQVPSGYTLVGIEIPELTSTTFTIQHCFSNNGTFKTLKDPLGIYGSAGAAITFTIGATSIGTFMIPPTVSALLNSWIKIVFSSSESSGFDLIFKQLA